MESFLFLYFFISPFTSNQPINKSYLFSPQNITLIFLIFTILITPILVQATTIFTWITAIDLLFSLLPPLDHIISIAIVWFYYEINQIRFLLCLKFSSDSQLRVKAEFFPMAYQLLYNGSQWTLWSPLLKVSPLLTLFQLNYLLYCF